MQMKTEALICDQSQQFHLGSVEIPAIKSDEILVRNEFSGVSIGTEFALVRNKLSWGPYPICTGYQAVGMVEAVGAGVEGFAVGDVVYHRGWTSPSPMIWNGGVVSCTSGSHCRHNPVVANHPTHSAAILPAGVDKSAASLFVLPAVAFHGVDMTGVGMGDFVAVFGVGMIGLGVVAAAALRGAVVAAMDLDPARLDLARQMGAVHTIDSSLQDPAAAIGEIAGDGADVVSECTGIPACIDSAIALCRPGGKFVFQGNYGKAPVQFDFLQAHGKQIKTYFPCDDGYQTSRQAVMRLQASGAVNWERTITHKIAASDSPAFFDRINRGQGKDVVGAVLQW